MTVTTSPPAAATPPPSPPRRTRQVRYWVAAVLCVGAIGALLIGGLSHNLVYFRTVSEAVKARNSTGNHRFRIAGAVVYGSVHETRDGVTFQITDNSKESVRIDHTGDPPELFKEGAPVVCEGHWGRGLVFDSDRILIKHGASYTPPKVDQKTGSSPTTKAS